MNGFFLAIEGIDGAGKTTLAGLLVEQAGFHLAPRHFPTLHAHQKRRRLEGASLEEVQQLYFEQLREVSQQVVEPLRNQGECVLADRWIASQIACNALHQRVQGVSLPPSDASGIQRPDMCLLLTAADTVRRARLSSRGPLSPNDEASLLPGAALFYRDTCYASYAAVVQIDTTEKSPIEVLGAALQHLKRRRRS